MAMSLGDTVALDLRVARMSVTHLHACRRRPVDLFTTEAPPPLPPPPLLLPSIRFCFSHSFRRLAGVPTVVAVIALFTGFRSWFSLFFFCFGCERLRSSCNTYSIWIGNCYAFHFYGDHFVHSVHIDWFHLLLLLHDSFVMLKEVAMNGNNRMIISMISTYVWKRMMLNLIDFSHQFRILASNCLGAIF